MKNAERWIEWGKDLLIVLLTLSAAWLLSMLMFGGGGLSGLVPRQPGGDGPAGGVTLTAATLPASIVITGEEGRYGVQYDPALADELFARIGPLLGDALASAEGPRTVEEAGWLERLSAPGLFLDLAGDIPLTALGGWLSETGECALSGSARRILLCAGAEDGVELCWQDADSGLFYCCGTALTQSLHLSPIIGDYRANGAYFAYEDDTLSALLQPCTLITEEERAGAEYAVTDPLTSANTAVLLEALSFSDQNHTRVSGGEAYVDDGDRLEIEDGGDVVYRAAQGGRYPAGSGAGEAIEAARALAESAVGPLCGEAELYLLSARQEEDGYAVTFGYRLSGSAVRLYGDGWCARFLIRDGYITGFTLRPRGYTATGETALLLPIGRAAAMLPDLAGRRLELSIVYLDGGGDVVSPQWAAE